jgi:hypothetical protein
MLWICSNMESMLQKPATGSNRHHPIPEKLSRAASSAGTIPLSHLFDAGS